MIKNQFGKTLLYKMLEDICIDFRPPTLLYGVPWYDEIYEVYCPSFSTISVRLKRETPEGGYRWSTTTFGLPPLEVIEGIHGARDKESGEIDLRELWSAWESTYKQKMITDRYSDWHLEELFRNNRLLYDPQWEQWEINNYAIALDGSLVRMGPCYPVQHIQPEESFPLSRHEAVTLLEAGLGFNELVSEWLELSHSKGGVDT